MRRSLFPALLLALSAAPAVAQSREATSREARRWVDDCEDNGGRDERERYCTVREQTIGARSQLRVDGRQNGGVSVIGSDRSDILVISKIQAQAGNAADAKELADGIRVDVGDEIRADGPATRWRSSWSVSYEIHVPRKMNLDLRASNGGISIENVDGRLEFETTNGGITLNGVSGSVRGETSNGGVEVRLTGDRWSGEGLDVRSTNGGVEVTIPANYSARLETGTTNGGMDIGFPITVQGRLNRHLSTQLGNGGALVRVTTTNGGVTLRRR
jgi:Putative adhesin